MELAHYIEELLYQNDCVILPSIGGFIVNYSSASIQFVDQQILPPRRQVSFNGKLVNNDGLLTNFIAQKEHLNYKQAQQKVQAYSEAIENDLLSRKVVHLERIGKLYFNNDSKLEFVPESTNFLRDAYGLPDVACFPVLRDKSYLQEPAPQQALTIKTGAKTPGIMAFVTRQRLAGAAAILLLFLTVPFIYQKLSGSSNNNNTVIAEETTTVNKQDDSNQVATASILPNLNKPNLATDSLAEEEEDSVAMVLAEEEAITAEPTETFVIVLGAFSKVKNANRLAKKLEKDNYFPDVTLRNGLHRVGVQISCTPEELNQHLSFLQENYNKKAWVVE